jgi:hypothetical protein
MSRLLRRALVVLVALALCVAAGLLAMRPGLSDADTRALAGGFGFTVHPVNTAPPGARTERAVAPALNHIRSWISAVGAAAALTDLRGLGHPADLCLVDPRDDSVTLRPITEGGGPQYPPVPLRPPTADPTVAPMGCVPADLDEDGSTDLIVYYWGRSPLIFLNSTPPGRAPTAADFHPVELVDPPEVWNTTALNVADVDGSGHLAVLVGNYFPDGARVLDPAAAGDTRMAMQDGMGQARNAGVNRLLLTTPTGQPHTRPRITDASTALPDDAARSWTLAIGFQDLTDTGLPSVYLANDFGPDQLLVNHSEPGHVRFTEVTGDRDLTTPRSEVLGHDSFKGMGVTFSYGTGSGLPTIVVSDITSRFALQESNLVFEPTGTAADLRAGRVPYRERSEQLGMARSGWCWDVKAGDFDNSGTDQYVQAVGFVRGEHNRWPQLQELAMANNDLLQFPAAWPNFEPGDDLSGHEHNKFWVRDRTGRYTDLTDPLGIAQPGVTRGFALGDVTGDGRLSAVVANQWADSTLLLNQSPVRHPATDLHLVVPGAAGGTRSAIGAQVEVPARGDLPAQKAQLYPANGHAGVSAADLHLALPGPAGTPFDVSWRDTTGQHRTRIAVTPGHHTVLLTSDGQADLR